MSRHCDGSPPTAAVRRRTRAAGAVGAACSGLVTWLLGGIAGADYRVGVPAGSTVLDAPTVVVTTVAIAVLGWAVLATLEKLVRGGARAWTALAVLTTVASMAPIGLVDTTTPTRSALAMIHVVVATVLISAYVGIRTSARPVRGVSG